MTNDFFLQFLQAFLRGFVAFFLQGLGFDLELDQAPLQAIQHFRLGVDFHTDTAGGLVDQVDGLVRQLTIGDVAVAELGRRDDRAIGDRHLVVDFIALLEATQDSDGVLFARLVHQYFLEAPLEGCVLLYVLTVLVERGRADAMQLTTGQRGLEHVAGVHRAFAFAGADHGVQFVDEQNDLSFLLRQLIEQGLEPLFELAPVLGTGDQRPHVQGQQALALEAVRYFTVDDPLGQTLGNGGLAHAWLTDQHRVVLGAALQHLDRAADLVIATDHRVELAFFGALGQVNGVFIQRLTGLLVVGVVDGFAATQVIDGIFQGLLAHALAEQQLAQLAVLVHGGE
ncbi:hypothetical protein BN844_5401 [Pseudomonas sp. SHC52]|nr:hypothetical protein BN844_5401 [Pseudomonas sp. SHC52]